LIPIQFSKTDRRMLRRGKVNVSPHSMLVKLASTLVSPADPRKGRSPPRRDAEVSPLSKAVKKDLVESTPDGRSRIDYYLSV